MLLLAASPAAPSARTGLVPALCRPGNGYGMANRCLNRPPAAPGTPGLVAPFLLDVFSKPQHPARVQTQHPHVSAGGVEPNLGEQQLSSGGSRDPPPFLQAAASSVPHGAPSKANSF